MPKKRTKRDQRSGGEQSLPTLDSRVAAKRAEIARSQPTLAELSHLAAAFVAGHKVRSPEAVRQALNLWKACKDALNADVEQGVKAAIAEKEARAETAKIPLPDKFPVSLDTFLRLVASGKSVPNRYQKFRGYLADTFDPDKWKEERLGPLGLNAKDLIPPDARDWASDFIGELKQSGISEAQYISLAQPFLDWKPQHAAKQAREKAQNAARERWRKKKADQKSG